MLILLAYVLVTAGKVNGQSLAYQLINALGATGFMLNAWWHGAVPVVVLNLVWFVVAAVALFRLSRRRAQPATNRE